jgi:hypothetical protein
MKTSKHIISLVMLGTSFFSVAQEEEKAPLEINGYVRNYTGVLLEPPNNFSIIQNTLNLEFKMQTEKIGFYANPFVYQYENRPNVFDVREMYIDLFTKKVDFRIGRQQIIWGQADGVFITDIVSPKNLTDFLLWDFNEIRLGVNAIKTRYYPHDDHEIELVLIPSFTPTIAPDVGSIWRPETSFLAPVTFDYSKQDVPVTLENGEAFGRYSINKSAFDVQFMGGYTWNDDPNMHITKQIDTSTMQLSGLTITPEYHRLYLGGLSFNTDIKGFILRGEGAYYFDKYFQTEDPKSPDALIQKDELNYVIGLDKTIGDWKISGQFIQTFIPEYDDFIQDDEVQNLATLMINRTLFREKVRLELFTYYGIDNEDAFVRLRGFYFPRDAVSIELGGNIFLGTTGVFGQYYKNNMVYAKVKYNF